METKTTTPTDPIERVARVQRQFSSGRGSYEAPNGIIHYRVDCRDLAAVLKVAALASSAGSDDLVRRVADFLVDQRDEPWPNGTEGDRLHYWRDKAIKAANDLRASMGSV